RDVGPRPLQTDGDHAVVATGRVSHTGQFGPEAVRDRPVVGVVVGETAPEPGATRSPRKGPGHGAVDRRGEISLVRACVAAATGRVDHERLERLPPRVDTCVGNAPRGEHFVLVAGPRPRRGDPRARPRQPFGPAGGLPLVAAILLAVAVRVPTAEGQAAAQGRSEEHTSELQSPDHLVCRLLLEPTTNSLIPPI